MNIIEQSAHIVDPIEGDILRQIEALGRVCYKSEDKITSESAAGFIKRAIDKNHNTVLEMAVIHLLVEFDDMSAFEEFMLCSATPFLHVTHVISNRLSYLGMPVLLSGNVRAFREIDGDSSDEAYKILHFLDLHYPELFEDIMDKTNPPDFGYAPGIEDIRLATPEELMGRPKHTYVCVRFITSRDVTHQLVRYRLASPLQESQRYCRYTANRFGNSVTFIRPCWYKDGSEDYEVWKQSCEIAEKMYFKLVKLGSSEKARTVLPNSTKSELLIYANLKEWQHIFNQRVSPHAYAPTRELLAPLYEEFKIRYKGMIV